MTYLEWVFHYEKNPIFPVLYVFSMGYIILVTVGSFLFWALPDPVLTRGYILALAIQLFIFISYSRSPE